MTDADLFCALSRHNAIWDTMNLQTLSTLHGQI